MIASRKTGLRFCLYLLYNPFSMHSTRYRLQRDLCFSAMGGDDSIYAVLWSALFRLPNRHLWKWHKTEDFRYPMVPYTPPSFLLKLPNLFSCHIWICPSQYNRFCWILLLLKNNGGNLGAILSPPTLLL